MSNSLLEDSEVFPVGWSQCVLGDVVSLKSGFAYKSQDWVEDGVAVIKIANVRNGKVTLDGCSYVTDEVAGETADFEVLDGHLLMTLTGEIGAIGIYTEHRPARLNQRVARIDLKQEGENIFRYLCLFLESPQARDLMWSRAQGMAQPNISPKEVLQIPFPLAPSDEQMKIVEILEEQLSRLDAALASVRAVREKSERFRRSLLYAAFSGALTSRDESIGTSSRGWTHKKLSALCDVRDGTHDSPKPSEAGHPLVTSKNIKNGRLDLEKTYLICDADFDEINLRSKVDKFDLLIGMIGTVGEVCIVTVEPNFAIKNVGLIKTGDEELSRLIRFFLLSPQGEEQIAKATSGTTQRFIPLGKLRLLDIPLPPRVEMLKIFEILEEQLSRLDASLETADVIEKKASALRRSLLHAAFSGDLTKEWREAAYV